MFEAEFTFNTSESLGKDLAVIATLLALVVGIAKYGVYKEARDGKGAGQS